MNVSHHPVPLELHAWMKLMGTVAYAHLVAVAQDAKKLQEGLVLAMGE